MAKEGMTYAPEGASAQVVQPGEFVFAASHLDHGHVYGQVIGLQEAGGTLKWVFDPDPKKVESFRARFPNVKVADSFDQVLGDNEVKMVTSAAVPSERGPVGLQVLDAGKDYFTDKSPFTTLDQLEAARKKVAETGQKYMVYYSERLHNHAGFQVGEMLREGIIGRVLQVLIMAPHRLSKPNRPDWFFEKDKYGGILTDIGSHQFEQSLYYTSAKDAKILAARVENFANPDKPGLEDFGEAMLQMENGASCYCRVDWFTPDGLGTWGDGRTFILGEKGYIEVRKYWNFGVGKNEPRIIVATESEEKEIPINTQAAFPYFGRLILDSLNRTENAMTQEHAFKAAELSMKAQEIADRARS